MTPEECPQRTSHFVPLKKCKPSRDAWCRKGAIVAADRTTAPVLLAFKGTELESNRWRYYYDALSDDVR